jgi:type IV fimbrial biogenesis protein FimT
MKRSKHGFTLVELVIVLAVSGTLMGIAVPSMLSAMYAAESGETKAALLTDLMKASTKAGIHGVRTTLCPSFDGRVCNAGFDWSAGWIAFIDQNGSREREPDETLLSVRQTLQDTRLISSSGRTRIVFQGNGGNAGSNVTFTLCDRRGAGKAQTLVISNTGNLRAGQPNAAQIALACTI